MRLSVLLLTFEIFLCSSESVVWRLDQHWVQPYTEFEVNIMHHTVHLFCFSEPKIENWISHCLTDHDISLGLRHPNGQGSWDVPQAHYSSVNVFQTIDADQLPKTGLSCASLNDVGRGSESSSIFSFLFSILPDDTKTLNSSSTLRWMSPTFPSSCFAVCDPSTPAGPTQRPALTAKVELRLNELHFLLALLGLVLLLSANYLSEKISFYYASGVGFVVLSSLLVLLIVLIRMLPMKRGGAILQSVFVLLGGTFGVVFMLLDYIRSSVWQILASNAEITFCYVAIVGCLSFVFFYWFHLPETLVFKYPRTKIIMKYLLRIVGALVITSAIYLPFTEHELLTGLAYYASSYISNKVTSESPVTRILEYTSPKLARVIIVMAVVLFVEFMEWVQQIVWKPSPLKGRAINGYPEVVRSSPGSPWASSSPFQYHSPYATAKTQTPRSVGFRSDSRTASLHKGPGFVRNMEYNNSPFRPSRSGYGEPSYRKIPREEILTDDESD
ncbi:hypothetical protein CRM22_007575 [Opisthorchis felineus]|uniref:Intimal thickness related receptor IRP domain-containing protein n=1 Tax=Opisthorchis felineus TaxID=147828 RepID=A0A4S2LNJ8_OPIFE|nr:hypothetical protein CRM22_007575 [Opisthorchis felineus]